VSNLANYWEHIKYHLESQCWVSESNLAKKRKGMAKWVSANTDGYAIIWILVTCETFQKSDVHRLFFRNCLWSSLNLEIAFKILELLTFTWLSSLIIFPIQIKEQLQSIVINCKKLNSFLMSAIQYTTKIKLR
jgi:hypothetical protein